MARCEVNGDMLVARYADDLLVGFEHEAETRRFWDAMRKRFEQFSLELHGEETWLLEFGRYAIVRRQPSGHPPSLGQRTRTSQRCLASRAEAQDPWRDGTTHLVMSALAFMQRLAALVPRPRLHLNRFHGVLAPNAKLRTGGVARA